MAAESESGHKDAILDCAYNFFGKRLATCSVDHTVIVWDQNEAEQWEKKYVLEKHCSAVHKIDWAHPEFGQALASCSSDRTVVIWEETQDRDRMYKWAVRAQLVDSRSAVLDVKFAPRHLGLKLATASEDGCVRIYEAVDVMNLAYWPLSEEFMVHKSGVSCLAWNLSRFDPPALVVGSSQIDSPTVKIWQYSESDRAWRPIFRLEHTGGQPAKGLPVRSVDWAPKMGRSFHSIATAFEDTVRIWEITEELRSGTDMIPEKACETCHTCKQQHDAEPDAAASSEVWQVKWNVTGTVLASSGVDTVRLWKCSEVDGKWKLHAKRGLVG